MYGLRENSTRGKTYSGRQPASVAPTHNAGSAAVSGTELEIDQDPRINHSYRRKESNQRLLVERVFN